MPELPTGTVTFVFTDIEGSTRLLQDLGERWPAVLEDHHRLLRAAIGAAGGLELRTEGDAFFAVFRSAASAVTAAAQAQRALASHPWPEDGTIRVRMGMHTGDGALSGGDYVGLDVHRAARVAAAAHGGQVLLSEATRTLVERSLPGGVRLRDLGPHRLKDLARPERLHQLDIDGLTTEFPPVRSLETSTNLPSERTAFLGRDDEVERIQAMLRGPGLLTLTGPGGTGKTRLALEAARRLLEEYPDGVFFVDLSAITDAALVASSIAAVVGVRAEGHRSVLATLAEELRGREMLLVLDNLEQVLAAAPQVAELLVASPRLRVLATSREPLRIAAEQELPVAPLPVPEAGGHLEELAGNEAIALFLARATAVDPEFRLTEWNAAAVAEICRRLDGLPLAIELAASRVKLLPPEAIVDRLEHRFELLTGGPVDVPARQRTLREAIAWSYDLLEEPERVLFRRLSVFAGGWTLEGAEAVADGDLDRGALEILGSLLDKSLAQRQPAAPARFGMLETIREFAAERIEADEARRARERHTARFVELAEAAEPNLRGLKGPRWLGQLEEEHDNLRAALRRSIDAGEVSVAFRLVGALWRFWHMRGHLAEGRRWAEEALAMDGAAAGTAERGKALTALGGIAYWQEDTAAMRTCYEEALEIARELGDRVAEAEGVYNMAFVHAFEGDLTGAVALTEQARAMYEELGILRGVADTAGVLAIVARLDGDLARARMLAEESVRLAREAGDRFGTTDGLNVLGRNALAQGDLATAEESLLQALANHAEIGNRTGMGIALDNLGAKASAEGDHLRAVRLGAASSVLKEAAGGHAPPPLIDLPDPRERARSAIGDAATDAAWKEGRAMTLEQVITYAHEATSGSEKKETRPSVPKP